jgi:predicted MFS family arabinose efflux permease
VGYVLTILALAANSLWLVILGRAVTGFTAGNQPIAQAAMTDLSRSDAEKTKNLGYCVSALSIGLITGPIVAGLLSSKSVLGDSAFLALPFYVAMVLVLISIVLIVFFFDDKLETRASLWVMPIEVFRLLWQITQNPTVLRISAVYFFFMFTWNTFVIFIDNHLFSRFQFGTFGNSMAMLVIGVSLVVASTFLVSVLNSRLYKRTVVVGAAATMALSSVLVVATPWITGVLVAVVPMSAAFAVGYATLLSIYSASVDSRDQGWVMGVTAALWTLGAGLTSLIGGS